MLLETISGGDPQKSIESLIIESIPELESDFKFLSKEEKRSVIKFSFGLLQVKSVSKSLHQARMSLLSVVFEQEDINELLEYEFGDFDVSKNVLYSVEISCLEIRMFLEQQLIELEENKDSIERNTNNTLEENDENLSILVSSFRVIDSLLVQLNKDESLDYLESSKRISGTEVVSLVDLLREISKHCTEFVLEVEGNIKNEFELNTEKGILQPRIAGLTKASRMYWIIHYCNSISSKWQIIEPDQELHKYIKLLEIVSRYLNPLHFASAFPTLVHLSVLDWANTPGILEALVTSLLSFCSMIKEEQKGDHNPKRPATGLYSGLYYAGLLVTTAWWSPGIDSYRTIASGSNNGSKTFEYLSRNYLNLSFLENNQESVRIKERPGTKMLEFMPLNTNTIPEYAPEDSPGVNRIRKIAFIVFEQIKQICVDEFSRLSKVSEGNDLSFLESLNSMGSPMFYRISALVQTLICVLTLFTCRIQNSIVPEDLWAYVFSLIIRMTPKSSKGYYFDSHGKITFFISLLRCTAIAFSSGYSEYAKLFENTLETLKIETTYSIPKLIIRDDCEEFSEEDEEVINFFRSLLDIN
ncbi:hypothetical protein HWI79_1851 [Cryptosporidium felis]|nr:hypothetical protein HWI79_1851 [Cryptosporidium felis]